MPDASEGFPDTPDDVEAIRHRINAAFDVTDDENRKVGDAKCGVYLFYDYDREPIYVGRTAEKLRTRIRRHLTNQRTDAVAMSVLDPFEVAEIEMWPFWDLQDLTYDTKVQHILERAEYTVYQLALKNSRFGAVLNEKEITEREIIDLPRAWRSSIIPDPLYEERRHPDIRIARRALTISSLAKVIRERSVRLGLRKTLIVQAKRLEWLARDRYKERGGSIDDLLENIDNRHDDKD